MKELFELAMNARTIADVDALEARMERVVGGARTRLLGDTENNWSALAGPANPVMVIWERLTNIFDAIIEAYAHEVADRPWKSPRAAVEALLKVPTEGISALSEEDAAAIAAMARVTLLDSDDSVYKPTLAFRDLGIGLTPIEMPDTILSVEGSNKLRKPYMHGVFGKGGSVACLHSDATIVISRKRPELLAPGEEDRVSLAIIRQRDNDEVRTPFFRYLVDPLTKQPVSMPADELDFEPGTLVMHINYRAEMMGKQNWQFEQSIYAYGQTLLFRPALPWELEDARTVGNTRPINRRKPSMIRGLGHRLDNTKDDALLASTSKSYLHVPGVGDIGVRWWLMADKDTRRKRAAKGFVCFFLSGGQIHHSWDEARFAQLVDGRRRVGQRLLAEIDTDGLDPKMRVRIFSSFRDSLQKGPEGAALERAVAEWLAADPDLEDAESQLVVQALGASSGQVSGSLRQRLNRAVKLALPGLGAGRGQGGGARPPQVKPANELYDIPTTLTGPEDIEALPGMRKTFYVQCNAKDGFVPNRAGIEIVAEKDSPDFKYGKGDLRHGRLQMSIFTPIGTDLHTYKLEVVLSWPGDDGGREDLRWPIDMHVVDEIKPPKPPSGKGKNKASNKGDVAIIWSNLEEQSDWTAAVAGDLQDLKGSDLAAASKTYKDLARVPELIPTVVLNEKFKEFEAYVNSVVTRTTDSAIETRRERYALAVGIAIANLYANEKKLSKAHDAWKQAGRTGAEPAKPMIEDQLRRAVGEHARGVVALLPDFDEALNDLDLVEHDAEEQATPTADVED
jgi:hypothetical protein